MFIKPGAAEFLQILIALLQFWSTVTGEQIYALVTLTAVGPFWPISTSKVTLSPSLI